MNSQVQAKYLVLLHSAIGLREADIEIQPEEVSGIVQLAVFQGTGPLIFDQLLKKKDVEISAPLRMQMKQQCVASMFFQQSTFPRLSQAWTALEQNDIHPVLLKGFGLAQYYPQPHLRQWGDIDIYVGKTNFHKACAILRETFDGVKHTKHDDDDYKHYNFEFDNVVLELHRVNIHFTHPKDRRYYEQLETKYQTYEGPKFDINGLEITVPENTFNVFFVFIHAWHHFIESGMNMKQLCDISILLHALRDKIDKKRLYDMLTTLRLMEVWQLFMYILVHHLRQPQEECIYYSARVSQRAEMLFERIMREGQSRKKEVIKVEGISYFKRKWTTFQLRIADSRLVRPYAPRYARHMLIGDLLHGIERTITGK